MPTFDEIMDELLHKSKFLENLFQNNVILRCVEFAGKKDYGFLWSIKNEIGPIMAYLMLTERGNLNDIKIWKIYAEIFSANYIKMAKTIETIGTVIKNLSLEEYCTFIKIRPYPRNHSDVDLLTSTPNELVSAFKNLGFNIISKGRTVIKMGKKGFLPIELHSELSWNGLEPIGSAAPAHDIINDTNCKKFKQEDSIKDLPWGFLVRY